MHKNVTLSIGSLALIDKIDARTGILEKILGGLEGRSKSFIPSVKLLITNQLGKSGYFEGKQCPLGERGYSRDNQPGQLQFMFGISVGLNNVPSMLTIQKGNVQDKTHMRSMIRLCSKILSENSLLVFDCGGNTNDNKKAIRASHFHYLTLRGMEKGPFLKAIETFH